MIFLGMSMCYECRKEVENGVFRCDDCLKIKIERKFIRRKPMSKWEEMKLGWIKNEKKWIENIRQREIIYDRGKPIVVLKDNNGKIIGKMPHPKDKG